MKFFLEALSRIEKGEKESVKIWVVAPTYELTHKVFEYVTRFLLAFDKSFGQYISGGQGRPFQLKMSEGIWIQCKSTTEPMSMLGEELDLEVIDEAALIPEKVMNQYIYPTTMAKSRDCRIIMISTPRGKNWFINKFHILEEKKAAFHFTSLDGVETDELKLAELKKTYPELLFRQEYLAEFVDEAGTVFRNLEDVIVPFKPEEGKRDHYYVMGVDIGNINDFTVITVIDRDSHRVVHWDRFKGTGYDVIKDKVRLCSWRYNNARTVVDATGVGAPICEDLRNAGVFIEDFTFSGKSKEELVGREIVAIDEKYIYVPNIPELISELKAFEYKYINEKTGEQLKNVKYGAPSGFHDDAVMSLGLAVWGLNLERPKNEDPIAKELAKTKFIPRKKSYV